MFCCFKDLKPTTLGIIGLIASILSFALLIWGMVIVIFSGDGVKAVYDIGFIIIILCFIIFIILLIFLNLRNNNRLISNAGRIICIVAIILSIISFILLLVVSIQILYDYAKSDVSLSAHEWIASIIPSLISLISLIVMALIANVLYKVFSDNYNSTPAIVSVAQNSMPVINNNQQSGIFHNDKANNDGYPVIVEKTGTNLNI